MSELPSHTDLTHSQRQIWIGQRLNPDSPLYNMAFAFVFAAEVRPRLFQRAWQRVFDTSDALRTSVDERNGEAVRRVGDVGGGTTEVRDLQSEHDPLAAFHQWCRERCARALPLDGELVDSVLVLLGDGRTGWYLNQHHLIADAWSTVLLYRQVAAEYSALLGDVDPPEALRPYYRTAAALIESTVATGAAGPRPESSERAAAREHWTARLARPERTVPMYGPHGAPRGTASTRLTLTLARDRSRALDALCSENGFQSLSSELSRFGLFATLLVSWLHCISGRYELGFDAPVAGRPTAASKRSLGLFIEMFPFVTTLEPHETFRTLARKCLDEAQIFLRHARPGLSAPSAATVSNVVLNFFPEAFGPFAGVPSDVAWVHPGHGDRVHALRLQVHDFTGAGRYVLHFDVNNGALPDRLRQRSLEHFQAVLDALLENPDREIASIDVRTDDERQDLDVFNRPADTSLPDRSVIDAFHAQAASTPDRVAVRQGEQQITFKRLKISTEALAATLVSSGVARGDRVALLASRSISVVTAVVATLRARAAYVPIDPSSPRTRVEQIWRDSGARLLLVDDAAIEDVPDGVTVLPIGEGIRAGQGRPVEQPPPGLDDLAYLLYTSGSTGQPKGVLVAHDGLSDYVEWAARQYVRGDRLTYPLFTSLSFDLTVTSLFLPLITGGVLEVYPEPDGPVDSAVMDVVNRNAVDFIKLTPSHLSLLRRLDLRGSHIQRMVVGGEDFKAELAASISSQFGDRIEIYNEYGPTEAVVGCVVHRYDPARDLEVSVPIGAPADHVEVAVLNEQGVPVPEGVPGELWVSRPGLARGYHGLAEPTAEQFRPHPLRPAERRYRTGDMVRFRDARALEYLGRRDRQLKISGFRVEPGEIEAVLLSLPTIEQAAVVARRRPNPVAPSGSDAAQTCIRCGLPSNYPTVHFDPTGLCNVCRSYESIRPHAEAYFRTMPDLRKLLEESSRTHDPPYDCMMLLSGGKDSTYALCRLVDMGLSVYAFTLDNGYISEGAKTNMRRVTEELDVPLEFGSTPAMNAIFRDSLMRFSNVCHGCFKTIYTLSTNRAAALGIPVIVTGLSRGQMFETRLTDEMFRNGRYSPEDVDAAVLKARRVYHRVNDEVARSLDVRIFQDDRVFEQIQFVDFYRYCDVGLPEMLAFLQRRVPWVRPADTGRSTNCLINDVGIYIHQKERGYHNYALPYSWDVRLGHKDRTAALDELNDELDLDRVRQTLVDVGYDEERLTNTANQPALAAFYVASEDVEQGELRQRLAESLPAPLVPRFLTQIDAIPLTPNGKVDDDALVWAEQQPAGESQLAPEGPVEEYLVGAWQEALRLEHVGAGDNFFSLGGTSLSAMEMMIRLCNEFDIMLPLETLFTHPTVRELARVAEQRILDDVSALTDIDS